MLTFLKLSACLLAAAALAWALVSPAIATTERVVTSQRLLLMQGVRHHGGHRQRQPQRFLREQRFVFTLNQRCIELGRGEGICAQDVTQKLHVGGKLLVQNESQSGTYTMSYWFPSGTTTSICTLSNYGQDTVAVASIDWASLYAYAGANFGIGHGIAGTRRSNLNTIWTNNAIYTLNNGDTANAPTFTWNNGVLQLTTGGSVQVTATIRIAVHGATLTFNI